MPAARDAFMQEHRRCELDGAVDGERVWMSCDLALLRLVIRRSAQARP